MQCSCIKLYYSPITCMFSCTITKKILSSKLSVQSNMECLKTYAYICQLIQSICGGLVNGNHRGNSKCSHVSAWVIFHFNYLCHQWSLISTLEKINSNIKFAFTHNWLIYNNRLLNQKFLEEDREIDYRFTGNSQVDDDFVGTI